MVPGKVGAGILKLAFDSRSPVMRGFKAIGVEAMFGNSHEVDIVFSDEGEKVSRFGTIRVIGREVACIQAGKAKDSMTFSEEAITIVPANVSCYCILCPEHRSR